MEIVPVAYFDDIKRYWRRRSYRRLNDAKRMKKKIKIVRLGVKKNMKMKIIKKVLAKFHEAYVDALVRLSGNKKIENFADHKRLPKTKPTPLLLPAFNNQMVDATMVLEIYNRFVSMRQQLV